MVTAELFRALGDPTRLEIVQRLASGEPYTLSSVSNGLGVTRQGARKHLQLLANAGLIKFETNGRNTSVTLDNKTLRQAKAFIAKLEQQWGTRLKVLQQIVDNEN